MQAKFYSIFSFLWWLVFIPFSIIDIFGIFVLISAVGKLFVRCRRLNDFEVKEIKSVFGEDYRFKYVTIKEHSVWAKWGAKYAGKQKLGFVLFRRIYFSREIDTENNLNDMAWLIHEMVHIKQYNKIGIVYIIKALRAQRNGGYSYDKKWLKFRLKDFNLEQQGEIAKHYYLTIKRKDESGSYNRTIADLKNNHFT